MRNIMIAMAALVLAACDNSASNGNSPASPEAASAAPIQQQSISSRPKGIPDGMGALPTDVPIPDDNPMSEARVELGKKLYFDPALSRSGNVSCNSCHNLGTWGVDNQVTSIGHRWQRGGRNAPTVLNSGFWSTQFWDGRAPQLEDQAKGPPLNPVEMANSNANEVVTRLRKAGYEPLFNKVFGPDSLTFDNMAKAIGAFERTLLTPDSPFDKYVRGEGKISPAAIRGMKKVDDIGCTACHSGPLFTNNTFQKFDYGSDSGRKDVTGKDEDDHMFRVQSWRNIAMTAPYFHDGSVKTLDGAVRVMAKMQLGAALPDADVTDIVAFLKTLTGIPPKVEFPVLPRPAGEALNWSD